MLASSNNYKLKLSMGFFGDFKASLMKGEFEVNNSSCYWCFGKIVGSAVDDVIMPIITN
jgi:large-conductance mechanosensitive channel